MCCDNVGFSEHCESIWNSATWLASYRMEITGWICIELLGLLGIVCHSDGNGGSSVIGCVYDVPAAYQFVPANAGMPPRRYADALGPAWLHSAFGGESTLSLEDRFFDRGPHRIRGFVFVYLACFAVTFPSAVPGRSSPRCRRARDQRILKI